MYAENDYLTIHEKKQINDIIKIFIGKFIAILDDKTRESASRYIKYLNSKGKTIILITHDDFYKEICDKMLMFSNSENPIVV